MNIIHMSLCKKYLPVIFLSIIFIAHLFFRFYQIEERNTFGWDQVDNAWAAKNIIVDHNYPLLGMTAKGNSGVQIGPAYYYLIAIFYFFTNLDPIASGIFAGVTSILTFLLLFYVAKKLFSFPTALCAVFIYTISIFIIHADRVQWPVNFITPVSLVVFYSLYRVLTGSVKYFLVLALSVGFSFHVHFTAIFFPLIVLCTIPFFPRNKIAIRYMLFSIPVFFVWFLPNILFEVITKGESSKNLLSYVNTYYHGLHLRRVMQLAHDAFIQFEQVLFFRFLRSFVFIFFPLFTFFYLLKEKSRERIILCYVIGLWFLIPWLVFAVYSGEITDYYFSSTRPIVIMILAYITVRIFFIRNMLPKIILIIFWTSYTVINIQNFFALEDRQNLKVQKMKVKSVIQNGGYIDFVHGSADSYLYYIYTKK